MCSLIMRAGIVLFLALLSECVVAKDDFQSFAGKWSFDSFRHETFLPESENVNDEVDLAIPWIHKSELVFSVDAKAKTVVGTLSIGDVKLVVNGNVGIDSTTKQSWISATASSKTPKTGTEVIYKLQGFLIAADSPVIVGSVVLCNDEDVGQNSQPVGTIGAFAAIKHSPKKTQIKHGR